MNIKKYANWPSNTALRHSKRNHRNRFVKFSAQKETLTVSEQLEIIAIN